MVAANPQWMNLRFLVQHCPKCMGIFDYVYYRWFRCRDCGRWKRGL